MTENSNEWLMLFLLANVIAHIKFHINIYSTALMHWFELHLISNFVKFHLKYEKSPGAKD